MVNRARIVAIVTALLFSCGPFTHEAFGQVAGSETRGADSNPAAEAVVTLNEQFLNSLLDAMFTKLRAPSFPLTMAGSAQRYSSQQAASFNAAGSSSTCASAIVLQREMNGVRTAVRFEEGRITAPMAFTGSYDTGLLGCLNFQGWADTVINLQFNRARQTLSANVTVVDIQLNGVPTLAKGVVINLVQSALDQRINPVEILQASHLTTRIPISAAGGALQLRATGLRTVVVPGSLRVHITYEFVRAD